MGAKASCCEHQQGELPVETVGAGQTTEEDGLEVSKGSQLQTSLRPSVRSIHSSLSNELRVMVTCPTMRTDLPMVKGAISFSVNSDLIRGIALSSSLRNFGRLWQTCPSALDHHSQTELWTKSQPVESFDVFVSHTWRTSGRRKFISLLFQYGWPTVMANCIFFVILVFLLGVFAALPLPLKYQVDSLGFKLDCPIGPWTYLTGTLTIPMSFLMFPYCSWASPKCFLDVVSIHQTDRARKLRGVYGLGGFLRVSKEMRVLWSPPYLTRLWCIFEIAAFRKVNPSRPLRVKPLFLESQVLLIIIGSGLVVGGSLLARTSQGLATAILVISFALLVPIGHANRKLMREEKMLTESLENFDLKNAECAEEADRVFVSSAITAWYGSEEEFTEYVRGPLREELLGASETDIPIGYVLLAAVSPFCFILDVIVGMIRAGAPVDAVLACFIGQGVGIMLLWTIVSLKVTWRCYRCWAAKCSTRALDYLVDFAIFLIWLFLTVGASNVARAIVARSMLGAAAVAAVSFALAVMVCGSCRRCQGL